MKAVFTALVVSLVFALFFTAFLVVPALVIGIAYFGMTWHHKRLSRRAKAARNDDGDDDGQQAQLGAPVDPEPPHQIDHSKPPLVGSPST